MKKILLFNSEAANVHKKANVSFSEPVYGLCNWPTILILFLTSNFAVFILVGFFWVYKW